MGSISYARHQFSPAVIQHAVWPFLRFTRSDRDIVDLLAERGLDISYETIRRWVLVFGRLFARELRFDHARAVGFIGVASPAHPCVDRGIPDRTTLEREITALGTAAQPGRSEDRVDVHP